MGRVLMIEDLVQLRSLAAQNAVAISPDGRWVSYAVQKEGDWRQRRLPPGGVAVTAQGARMLLTELDTGRTMFLVDPDWTSWAPAWSPNGQSLAFFAAPTEEGPVQVWLWDANNERSRCVTPSPVRARHLASGRPRWMADGRRLCVLFTPADAVTPPALDADEPQAAQAAMGPRVFQSPEPAQEPPLISGPADWADVAVIDVTTGAVTMVIAGLPVRNAYPGPVDDSILWDEWPSVGDRSNFEVCSALHLLTGDGVDTLLLHFEFGPYGYHDPRWSPAGDRIAMVHEGAVLVWLTANPEVPPERLQVPGGQPVDDGFALWTPDGDALVVRVGGALWRLAIADHGGAARPLTVPDRRIVSLVHRTDRGQLPPGDAVVLTRNPANRQSGLFRLPWDGSTPEMLTEEDRNFEGQPFQAVYSHNADATPDGTRFVFAVGDARKPSELWLATEGGLARRPVTDLNPHLAAVALGTTRRYTFRTAGGSEVGATILMPTSWREGVPCPTVVNFYPGSRPSAEVNTFSSGVAEVLHAQLLASRGYAVLTPDVPYDPASPGDPAEISAAAVLPAVNEAIRLGYSDPDRLAVTGQSYGGYGVLTLLCRTDRFRAAVASAAFSDLAPLYGRATVDPGSDIGWEGWCEHSGQSGMGGPPWEHPLRYVRNSPVFYADRIHTPLLLICGGADGVSPWSQSAEMFVALRRLRRRCTLLVYPEEGHTPDRFSRSHRDDVIRKVLAWFEEYLGAAD